MTSEAAKILRTPAIVSDESALEMARQTINFWAANLSGRGRGFGASGSRIQPSNEFDRYVVKTISTYISLICVSLTVFQLSSEYKTEALPRIVMLALFASNVHCRVLGRGSLLSLAQRLNLTLPILNLCGLGFTEDSEDRT
jgi:hypothetical protein